MVWCGRKTSWKFEIQNISTLLLHYCLSPLLHCTQLIVCCCLQVLGNDALHGSALDKGTKSQCCFSAWSSYR